MSEEARKRDKAKATLLKRINKAFREGKELDVTNIKEGGTYTRLRDKTTDRSTRKGIGIHGFPVISETYAAFKEAMNILGPEYEKYAELYKMYHGEDDNKEEVKETPDIEIILKNLNKKGSIDFIPPDKNDRFVKYIGNEKTVYGILPEKTIKKTLKSKRTTGYNFTKNINTEWKEPSSLEDITIKSSLWKLKDKTDEDKKKEFMYEINQILQNPYSFEIDDSEFPIKNKKSTRRKFNKTDIKEMEDELDSSLDFLKSSKKPKFITNKKVGFKEMKSTLKPRFTEYYESEDEL